MMPYQRPKFKSKMDTHSRHRGALGERALGCGYFPLLTQGNAGCRADVTLGGPHIGFDTVETWLAAQVESRLAHPRQEGSRADAGRRRGIDKRSEIWDTHPALSDRATAERKLIMEGAKPILQLNGCTLHIDAAKHRLGENEALQIVTDGGEIIWGAPGTMIIIR